MYPYGGKGHSISMIFCSTFVKQHTTKTIYFFLIRIKFSTYLKCMIITMILTFSELSISSKLRIKRMYFLHLFDISFDRDGALNNLHLINCQIIISPCEYIFILSKPQGIFVSLHCIFYQNSNS